MSDVIERPALLEEYLTESELSVATGKSERTLRLERQMRRGPPFIKWGHLILYSKEGFKEYLKSQEQPTRSRNRRVA